MHVSIINIKNVVKERIRAYQYCNTSQIFLFGRYLKVRESLYT